MSDDELIRRYLLGELPGGEREELEKRLLSEDDLFELAEAVEADVLEDYGRGELSAGQREQVARYLAASPEGRLRLAVLRGLSATAATAATKAPAGRLLAFPTIAPELERPQVRAAALAAMLMMAVGAFLLASWHPEVPINRAQNRFPTETLSPIVTPPAPTPPDRVAAVPTPTPPIPPTPAPAPSRIFSATLALMSLRGAEEIQSFDIPALADVFELRLTLPEGDRGYPSYQVAVRQDATGEEVTGNEGLRVKQSAGQLVLRVDASRFEQGRYSLTVQGVTPAGDIEDLAFPEFEVR